MKTSSVTVTLLFSILGMFGQQGVGPSAAKNHKPNGNLSSPYSVVQRDANSRVWQRTTQDRLPGGEVVSHLHTYTELATGMHYRKGGQWIESSEAIDLLPTGGAAATHGQHQVYFPYNIYNGVIEIVTPDGQHLKSRPMGISYFDGTNSVLIAELTNSIGLLVSSNQVIYTNCFTDIAADLVCTYRCSGFECDLVFRSQPPAPETFGLSVPDTRLELLTEFFDTPEPKQNPAMGNRAAAMSSEPNGASVPSLIDTDLQFGAMSMIHGKAFGMNLNGNALDSQAGGSLPEGDGSLDTTKISVAKTWTTLEGRRFLVEEVRAPEILPSLRQLPATPSHSVARISSVRKLPPKRIVQNSTNAMQVASAVVHQPGVVLDYNIVNSSTGYTFKGDTTYYVSGAVNLSGTNVIEGGAVIKYDTNYTCSVNILGSVICKTGPYHPAVFTTVNDASSGEGVTSPSSGCPQTYYVQINNNASQDLYFTVYPIGVGGTYVDEVLIASGTSQSFSFLSYSGQNLGLAVVDVTESGFASLNFASTLDHGTLDVNDDTSAYYSESGGGLCLLPSAAIGLSLANGGNINDLVFRYLGTGVQSSGSCSATNVQFVKCGTTAFETDNASLYAGNILISGSPKAFTGHGFSIKAEQLTCDNGSYVVFSSFGSSSAAITNSLITAVATLGNITVSTNNTVKLSSSSGVYQTVGAGSYYLATNTYRNIGTTNINPSLLASLQKRTTYAPVAYTSLTISTNAEFGARGISDTDTPDLGYHYAPLDYCFGNVTASSNLVFDAGTAVGWFETFSGNSSGIALSNNSTNSFNGTEAAPCVFARYNTVQEGGNGNWTSKGFLAGITTVGNALYTAQINATFTRCYALAWDPNHFRDYLAQLTVRANNCEFLSGSMLGYWMGYNVTNCLFDRMAWLGTSQKSPGVFLRNNTMHGGSVYLTHAAGNTNWPVWIENCAFDGSGSTMDNYGPGNTNVTYCAYNAFLNGAQKLIVTNAHDQTISNFTWQVGQLGNWYQSSGSSLINTGSVTADLVSLYHFTTQTNQIKETSSIVDIGYHYVALDSLGNAMDTDGDGIPDYLEDANGNGIFDLGDLSNWNAANPSPCCTGSGSLRSAQILRP